MKYILIFGGTGFIGSNLIHELVKQGKKVISFNRYGSNNSHLHDISDQIITINGNLSDISLLNEIFNQYKIEKVIHLISTLIPSSSLEDYLKEYESVIIPTIKLIELMNEYNVRDLIYLSSGGTIYGNFKENGYYTEDDLVKPINYYGLSKYNLEEYIKFEGRKGKIDYLILRPSNPFGKFQKIYSKQGLIPTILGKIVNEQEMEIWGDGSVIRDYIPIEYLCKCIVKLSDLNIKNEIYNVGSGVGYSINEIVLIIENILNIKVNIKYKDARNVDSNKVVLNIDKLKTTIDLEQIDIGMSILDFYNYILEDKDEK